METGSLRRAGAGKGKKGSKRAPSPPELYNLAVDSSETKNVAAQHSDIVAKMSALLTQIREKGRSRP